MDEVSDFPDDANIVITSSRARQLPEENANEGGANEPINHNKTIILRASQYGQMAANVLNAPCRWHLGHMKNPGGSLIVKSRFSQVAIFFIKEDIFCDGLSSPLVQQPRRQGILRHVYPAS